MKFIFHPVASVRYPVRFLLVTGLCIQFTICSPHAGAQEKPTGHVLLIGIDGLRPDALKAAETPAIDRLIREGAFSDTTLILGERYRKNDTVSGPGWSSYLTGVWADKHGVHDNNFEGRSYDRFPHIFRRIKNQFPEASTGSFVDWEPIDKYIVEAADVRFVLPAKGAEDYVRKDVEVADEAIRFLSDDRATAAMVYLGAVDETGHKYGFHSTVPEYIQAIEGVDAHVGRILTAVRGRKQFAEENWLVIVSTDHGGSGTGHGDGHNVPKILNTFLIVSGAAARHGMMEQQTYVVDVVPTALFHLGVKIQPEWQLDGHVAGLTNAPEK